MFTHTVLTLLPGAVQTFEHLSQEVFTQCTGSCLVYTYRDMENRYLPEFSEANIAIYRDICRAKRYLCDICFKNHAIYRKNDICLKLNDKYIPPKSKSNGLCRFAEVNPDKIQLSLRTNGGGTDFSQKARKFLLKISSIFLLKQRSIAEACP